MQPGAPLLHDDLFTVGVEPKPDKPSNVAKRIEIVLGDIEAGFAKADVIVEREFNTAPVHQGYIEPHATLASVSEDGSAEVWCSTQGHFIVRAHCARLLGMDIGKVRVTASEIGGGFGGKTVVYLEPLAVALSKKAKRPVKMVMSREDVFKSSGPTSGANIKVKMGATKDGKFVAGFAELKYQAGAFPGSPVQPGVMCAYAPVRHRERQGHRLRRGLEPAQGRRLPGARRADLRVRRRERGGRDREEARDRSGGAPAPERGARGHQGGLRPEVRAHRPHRHAPRRREDEPLHHAARGVAGPRRRLGLLVQHRRRDVRLPHGERGRHGVADGRHAGHRRAARLARHGRRRRARRPLRQGAPDHRRHGLARLQLPHRRQPLHLLRHHGRGGGGEADQERAVPARRQALGAARRAGRRSRTASSSPSAATPTARPRPCRWRTSPRSPARPAAPSAASGGSMPRARGRASAPTWSTSRSTPRPGA